MSEAPRRLSPEAREAVRGYAERLAELLDSCADHQQHDPEVFLWNARRSLEAICHILLTAQSGEVSRARKDERSLDAMIRDLRKLDVLDQEQGPRFDLARQHTNLGVHIRQPEREDYPAAVADVAHLLPSIVEWLLHESIAAPHLKDRAELATADIKKGGRPGPPPREAVRAAAETTQALAMRVTAVERERDLALRKLRAREQSVWRRVRMYLATAMVTLAVGTAVGMVARPYVQAAADGAMGVARASVVKAVAPPSTAAAPVATTAGASTAAAPVSATGVTTAGATAPLPAASLAPAINGPIAAAAAINPLPSSLPNCPTGMVRISATPTLRLGQPEGGRKNWPTPSPRRISPTAVPSFCLDTHPVVLSDYRASGATMPPTRECDWTNSKDEAAYCLTRDESERYCAWRGGRLPTLVEWEAAVRDAPRALVEPQREWTGERFPTRSLNLVDPTWTRGDGMWVGQLKRRPAERDGAVWLSWNQQPPGNRDAQRTFRCADDP